MSARAQFVKAAVESFASGAAAAAVFNAVYWLAVRDLPSLVTTLIASQVVTWVWGGVQTYRLNQQWQRVMASYNLVNGRPAHLSPLINDELRTWTTDEVLFVSDAAAPTNVATTQAYYVDHVARLEAVTLADVQRAGSEHIDPAKLTIVVVGDRAVIEPGLLELNLPIVHLDHEGRPVD